MFDTTLTDRQGRVDRLQIAGIIGLMLLGAAFVFSATRDSDSALLYNQVWFRQVVWYGVGLGSAALLCLVDYHTLARWSFVFYWVIIVLLI
ncbi:MAG: FtsW/RodA/SpoVE family cell cycle protein, partial [Verrucomicrobiota bacterium]